MAGFTDEATGAIQLFFDWPRGDMGVNLRPVYGLAGGGSPGLASASSLIAISVRMT